MSVGSIYGTLNIKQLYNNYVKVIFHAA